jgi:hypothetical protein
MDERNGRPVRAPSRHSGLQKRAVNRGGSRSRSAVSWEVTVSTDDARQEDCKDEDRCHAIETATPSDQHSSLILAPLNESSS